MKLRVLKADEQDVYRDIVRIPEAYRKDSHGTTLAEGEVCKVTAQSKNQSAFAILRGKQDCQDEAVWMDERTRNRLGLTVGEQVPFDLKTVGLWGQWRWAWSSSDPAYRVTARLALLSVLLGLLGVVLGIVSVWLSR